MKNMLNEALGRITNKEYRFAVEQVWRNEEQAKKEFTTIEYLEQLQRAVEFYRSHPELKGGFKIGGG